MPYLKPIHNKALILGTGGAAAAVEYVLKKLKIDYLFVSRNKQREENILTYEEVNMEVLNEYKLIINTTPLGMYPDVNKCPDIPYKFITNQHYLYDLVYNPDQTLFLKKGSEKGAKEQQNKTEILCILLVYEKIKIIFLNNLDAKKLVSG